MSSEQQHDRTLPVPHTGRAAQTDNRNRPTPLFLVLEGGGAKGIAHIAAWEALEQLISARGSSRPSNPLGPVDRHTFHLAEVAGTSAGAIVAAFIAAGARAEQLIDAEGRMPLSSALGIEYFHDLFGMTGWRRLKLWRRILNPTTPLVDAASRLSGATRSSAREEGRDRRRPRALLRRFLYEPLLDALAWARGTLRPVGWMLVGLACLLIAGWLLDTVVLRRPVAAGIDFIVFWIAAYLGFVVAKWAERRIERRGIRLRVRHPWWFWRLLLHPFFVCALALLVTYFLNRFTPLVTTLGGWVNVMPDLLGDGLLYGLCILLVAYTFGAYVRGFLKGAVRTRQLRRDFNLALITILTRNERFDPAQNVYVWEDKTPRNQTETDLFTRLRVDGYEVTFRDLQVATRRRLSVIGADVIGNEVRIYSTATHRNFPVAFAVTASLAIPFAFRAMRTWSRLLVDGGVVSSIPAWVFRRHRTRDPDARILAIGIAAQATDKWIPIFLGARRVREGVARKGRRWVARLVSNWTEPWASVFWPVRFAANTVYTTAYGARALELDASDRLDSFPLLVGFELLDFDKTRAQVRMERKRLTADAEYQIEVLLWLRQEDFERACTDIERALWDRARADKQPVDKLRSEGARLRFFWAVPEERVESVRIKRTYGFKREELDDRLVLPYGSTLAGMSAATGKSCFALEKVLEKMLSEDMNRYRQIVKWKGRTWCWSIPVTRLKKPVTMPHSTTPRETQGVFVIESNCPIALFGAQLASEGASRSQGWLHPNGELRRDPETGDLMPLLGEPTPLMGPLEGTLAKRIQEMYLELERARP